jgi:hypothetical protein
MQLVEVTNPVILTLANPAPGAVPYGPFNYRALGANALQIINPIAATAAVPYTADITATPISG